MPHLLLQPKQVFHTTIGWVLKEASLLWGMCMGQCERVRRLGVKAQHPAEQSGAYHVNPFCNCEATVGPVVDESKAPYQQGYDQHNPHTPHRPAHHNTSAGGGGSSQLVPQGSWVSTRACRVCSDSQWGLFAQGGETLH